MIPARARACRLVIALLLVAERVAAQHAPAPVDPWHGFAGLELSQSLDDVLARNAQCWPPLSAQPANPGFTPVRVAEFAFGFALPHPHRDTAAVRAALDKTTICTVNLLDDHARALVLAVGRSVVAVTVWFNPESGGDSISSDSIRAALRRGWRGGSLSPTLDSWYGARYRAFYLVPKLPRGAPAEAGRARLILVDIAGCTAFDRRVHSAPGSGQAEPC